MLSAWTSSCIVRGIAVGSRAQFEDMNRAIEAKYLKPIIDEKVWRLEELREAYQYMWEQKHAGKVVVSIAS
jgi:D-arabinose 1-dehydrogenase-like Zn-dependent alcohol dehydrogenase